MRRAIVNTHSDPRCALGWATAARIFPPQHSPRAGDHLGRVQPLGDALGFQDLCDFTHRAGEQGDDVLIQQGRGVTRSDVGGERAGIAAAAHLDRTEVGSLRTVAGLVPAYIVFSDAVLRGMARAVPRSRAELLKVPGIEPVKLRRYGDVFLELIRARIEPPEAPAEGTKSVD